jgi:hypothetical protein
VFHKVKSLTGKEFMQLAGILYTIGYGIGRATSFLWSKF